MGRIPSAKSEFAAAQREKEDACKRRRIDKLEDRVSEMRAAVIALLDAAYWHADRPCDAHGLWAELKRAALIEGNQ